MYCVVTLQLTEENNAKKVQKKFTTLSETFIYICFVCVFRSFSPFYYSTHSIRMKDSFSVLCVNMFVCVFLTPIHY